MIFATMALSNEILFRVNGLRLHHEEQEDETDQSASIAVAESNFHYERPSAQKILARV